MKRKERRIGESNRRPSTYHSATASPLGKTGSRPVLPNILPYYISCLLHASTAHGRSTNCVVQAWPYQKRLNKSGDNNNNTKYNTEQNEKAEIKNAECLIKSHKRFKRICTFIVIRQYNNNNNNNNDNKNMRRISKKAVNFVSGCFSSSPESLTAIGEAFLQCCFTSTETVRDC